jgi:hypothetical protein
MDRTGKRHMARRADDCKPILEGKPRGDRCPGHGESGHTGAIRLTDLHIPFAFCTNAGQIYAPFVAPH